MDETTALLPPKPTPSELLEGIVELEGLVNSIIDEKTAEVSVPDIMVNEVSAEMLRVIGSWPIRPSDPSGIRIVIVGNTFGTTPEVPEGDILIHTGNFCDEYGGRGQRFVDWIIGLSHKIKIITPGTYDSPYILRQLEHVQLGAGEGGVILLSGASTIVSGLRIFAPYVDQYMSGGSIPPYTTNDIILTHIPPEGVLDKILNGRSVGCDITLGMLIDHPPRICISGGVYAGYGYCWCYFDDSEEPTLCINAAMYAPFDNHDVVGQPMNPPIVLSIAFM